MFKALVLVRNLESNAESLTFGEFTLSLVAQRYPAFRELLLSVDVNQNDWILEKVYSLLPRGAPGSSVGGIPDDIESLLVLLRLFRVGDISFVRHTIILPTGKQVPLMPYRAINDLNSYSLLQFKIDQQDRQQWEQFAAKLRASPSWRSDWFAASKRFFLSGGAIQFNPEWEEVNRIVDYATALEAALVPELSHNTRRISRRAAALLRRVDSTESGDVAEFVKTLYRIRSVIVHGSRLNNEDRRWLVENWETIEKTVRRVLQAALQEIPLGERERQAALARLYDPTDDSTDDGRGEAALKKFLAIQTAAVRRDVAAKIAMLAEK